ncbi:MAG: DUF3179 domain-containing protein [Pseudomonadota bacterium]
MPSKAAAFALLLTANGALASPALWEREWPKTDFSTASVDLSEIFSGGPPKDGSPSIDDPVFAPAAAVDDIGPMEPVIMVDIDGDARAYPFSVLIWHEIVNDVVGGVPVAVTYCPLCNSALVFDRRLNGETLEFGVSGKLRHSDMIMYDRQTESWWQQFLGEGVVGAMTGERLTLLPARAVPFAHFQAAHPDGRLLVPNQPNARRYGTNPYVKYDSAARPFLYRGDYDGPGSPMSYVVAVQDRAWMMASLRAQGRIEDGDLVLSWEAGMNSALDEREVRSGRDIGFARVQRRGADGALSDVPFDATFAFAFKAFYPDGQIIE